VEVGAVASDANAMTSSTLKDEIDDGDDCDRWRTRWSTMMMTLVAVSAKNSTMMRQRRRWRRRRRIDNSKAASRLK